MTNRTMWNEMGTAGCSMGNRAPCVYMKIFAGVTTNVSRNNAAAQSDSRPADETMLGDDTQTGANQSINPPMNNPRPPTNSATPVHAT